MTKDIDADDVCVDCGHCDSYVDPDSGRCDLCAVVARAEDDASPIEPQIAPDK